MDFNFGKDLFQTENTSLPEFEIISVSQKVNKQYQTYTNSYHIEVSERPTYIDPYIILDSILRKVKSSKNLGQHDLMRFVIMSDNLPNAISTKYDRANSFTLDNLRNTIGILNYRIVSLDACRIVVQSIRLPAGMGRVLSLKDNVDRKRCVITINNRDSFCLARAIVTAYANLHSERWTVSQLKNGFNGNRKLQEIEALKLHSNADVDVTKHGNGLTDIDKFAQHLNVEINVVDSDQFNEIIYTANKGCIDKIYLLKTKNHFDVITSMKAYKCVPYFCDHC